jgi:iron complex transport system ATP-binding protein
MTAPLVAVEQVAVDLGGRRVVEGVDLAVAAGEIVAVVGPNGAGKSSLLGVMSGDLVARAGRVELDGRPIGAWPARELARFRAVLTQDTGVSFPFTVAEVVGMGRSPWAGTAAADRDDEVVADAMARAEIDHLVDRPYPMLSGGERARAALARVLAQDTPLLLLDEPTAALDIRHQELVFRLARQRSSTGCGVVVVIHDLGLAAAHADRIAVIDGGSLVACGPPDEVLTADLLTSVYRHDIDVVTHPRTGQPLVLPHRTAGPPAARSLTRSAEP